VWKGKRRLSFDSKGHLVVKPMKKNKEDAKKKAKKNESKSGSEEDEHLSESGDGSDSHESEPTL
jgi:hypothetical protein